MSPNQPVSFWHYIDFVTLISLTLIITALVKSHHKKTGGLLGSICETVAYSKTSSIIFSVAMTIFFPLYYAYIWFWVLPLIHAPQQFYYLLIFSAICEMVFVWVPATDGTSKRIHDFMASIVFFVMLILALLILIYGANIDIAGRISLSIYLITSLALLAIMPTKRFRRYTFLYEVVYCSTFLIALSVVGHA